MLILMFHKKGCWFKIRMEFLRSILAKSQWCHTMENRRYGLGCHAPIKLVWDYPGSLVLERISAHPGALTRVCWVWTGKSQTETPNTQTVSAF